MAPAPGQEPLSPAGRRRSGPGECLLAAALAGVVMLSRVPVIRYPVQMNVDESQMLAQALRYTKDIIPWRGVDGTSSGPLNTWYLLLPHLLGMRLYYPEAHLVAAVTWTASVFACWLAARLAFASRGAMAAAAMMAAWLVCKQDFEFLQYSSEALPVLLLSLALAAVVAGGRGHYLAALLLGLVPWSKLQAAPIGAAVGVWLLWRILWPPADGEAPRPAGRFGKALAVAGLSLLPSVALLAVVARGGALEEMWRSYVIANLYYAGPFDARAFVWAIMEREGGWKVAPWSLALLLMWLAGIAVGRGWVRRFEWRGFGSLAWLVFLASWYVCLRPEQGFEHYQLLLFPGLVLLSAATLDAIGTSEGAWAAVPRFIWVAVGAYLVLNLRPAAESMRHMLREPHPPAMDSQVVYSQIKELAPGSHGIAIWGWFPSLYVESGEPPATRHVIGHFLYRRNPTHDFLRATYMQDLIAERPQVFVDAHVKGLDSIFGRDPLRNFPALNDYVGAHYSWVCRIDGSSGPVEVYVRKD